MHEHDWIAEKCSCTLKDAATLRNELLSMSIGVYTRIMTQFCYPADGRLWIRISVAAYNYQDEYEVLRDAINTIVTKRSAGSPTLQACYNNVNTLYIINVDTDYTDKCYVPSNKSICSPSFWVRSKLYSSFIST